MRYSVGLARALWAACVTVAIGACADSVSPPRSSPVPAIIRTPPLGKLASRLEPRLDLATDCALGVSTDPACTEPCSSVYDCGDGGTAPGSGSGDISSGDLSSTHVSNASTVVNFTANGITAGAQATYSGNYYKQSATAQKYREGAAPESNTAVDESNETWSQFGGLIVVTKATVPTGGVTCGLTAGGFGVHRGETRFPYTGFSIGVKQVTTYATPKSQGPCQTTDGGGGGTTGTVTCVYHQIYMNGVLIYEEPIYCLV